MGNILRSELAVSTRLVARIPNEGKMAILLPKLMSDKLRVTE